MVKNPHANAEDTGSVSWSGRSPGEEDGKPFQYSCLGNPTDGLAHGVAKESDTTERLNNNSKVQGSIRGTIQAAAMSLPAA